MPLFLKLGFFLLLKVINLIARCIFLFQLLSTAGKTLTV